VLAHGKIVVRRSAAELRGDRDLLIAGYLGVRPATGHAGPPGTDGPEGVAGPADSANEP
jgi:hypothetical protein